PRGCRALRHASWLLLVAVAALPLSACSGSKDKDSGRVIVEGKVAEDRKSEGGRPMAQPRHADKKETAPKDGQKDKAPPGQEAANTEAYDHIADNPFRVVARAPLSTFSIDVDTASYTNVRRFLNDRQLPPKDAVRVEEFINYFAYDYPQPRGEHPFAV